MIKMTRLLHANAWKASLEMTAAHVPTISMGKTAYRVQELEIVVWHVMDMVLVTMVAQVVETVLVMQGFKNLIVLTVKMGYMAPLVI